MKSLIKAFTLLVFLLMISASAFAEGNRENVREIHVKGKDNLRFDVTEIEAEPGERLRITLEVVSNMPKQAMAHNLAIMDLHVDPDEFARASMQASDNEYIAPSYEDEMIAYTEMIGGGETSTIEFTVPETPGEYDYVCTFPGHFSAGMVGVLKVE